MMRTYPSELAHNVRLPSGAWCHIRPIRSDDEPGLLALFNRLSMTSRYQRFFSPLKRLPQDWLHHFANVDYRDRLALVAEHERDGRVEIVGVARYEPTEIDDLRETALVVDDDWHGKGLGTVLMEELLRAAEARGIRRFRAVVLAENHHMLHILDRVGTIAESKTEQGVVELVFTRKESTPRSA